MNNPKLKTSHHSLWFTILETRQKQNVKYSEEPETFIRLISDGLLWCLTNRNVSMRIYMTVQDP